MKKVILVLALLTSYFVASAQTPSASDSTYIYSMIDKNDYVTIDNGDGEKFIKDKNGNTLYFKSKINALNYLVANGWEFVQDDGPYIVRKKYPKSKVKKLINPIP